MKIRTFGLLLTAIVGACSETDLSANPETPDLAYTLIEASNAVETGKELQLLDQRCEKKAPTVEPVRQKWFCRFRFRIGAVTQDCSAILSIHADDHHSIWKPDLGQLNPSTGMVEPNLACKPRPTAS